MPRGWRRITTQEFGSAPDAFSLYILALRANIKGLAIALDSETSAKWLLLLKRVHGRLKRVFANA
jgi:hypothetical protein